MAADPLTDLSEAMIEGLHPLGAPTDDDLHHDDETDDGDGVRSWVPDSLMAADWVARKAQRAQRALDDIDANYRQQLAMLDAWRADARKQHERTQEWAGRVLEVWLRCEIEGDESRKPRKSRTLPCGVKVAMSGGQPKLEVDDPERFEDWLMHHRPDLIEEEVVVRWSKTQVAKSLRDDADRLVAADPETGERVEAVGARVSRSSRFNPTWTVGGGS